MKLKKIMELFNGSQLTHQQISVWGKSQTRTYLEMIIVYQY